MRGAFILAAREVAQRRAVLIAAAVGGILPFASPFLPGVPASQVGEARDVMAVIVALAFTLATAVLLGVTVVGRDLSEGRLAFDFARPLSGLAIWAGRFLGALALVALVLALSLLPTALVGGGAAGQVVRDSLPEGACAVALLVLTVLPLTHAAGVAFRSRSRWLGVDLSLLVVVFVLCGHAAKGLYDAFAFQTLLAAGAVLGAIVLLALWIASALQVIVGRTDLVRGHRILSISLWSALLAGALAFQVYTRWALRADPDRLQFAGGFGAPQGNWALVGGTARGTVDLETGFLVDTTTGRFVRVGAETGWGFIRFSQDGRHAAWLRMNGPRDPRATLWTADLSRPEPEALESEIVFPSAWAQCALSPDGSRLAAIEDGLLSVHEISSGKTLAALKIWDPSLETRPLPAFVSNESVRVYRSDATGSEIVEVDVPGRSVVRHIKIDLPEGPIRLTWNARHDRLLARDREERAVLLVDGEDGSVLARLGSSEEGTKSLGSRFLEDGRIAVVEVDGRDRARVVVHGRDGAEEARIELGPARMALLGGEVAPGVLAVTSFPTDYDSRLRGTLFFVDLAARSAREIAGGGTPEASQWWFDPAPDLKPGSAGTVLFRQGDALVRLDPGTGEARTVAGP